MSAEILRAAADRLDELAGAATPGPWEAGVFRLNVEVGSAEDDLIYRRVKDLQAPADAAYIAAMHPEVGKALSAWLRAEYAHAVAVGMTGTRAAPALTIARLILGEVPA